MANEKFALITGANRGIGLEVARQLARDYGYTVLIGARNAENGNAAVQILQSENRNAHFVLLDVADAASIREAAQTVTQQFGILEVLVNNAGGGFDFDKTATTSDLTAVEETLQTNLLGPWRMTQAFLPLLQKSPNARIVNVSSQAGAFMPFDGQFNLVDMGAATPGYGVSKAALNALTVKLANDLKASGILVNAVCPGFTATHPGLAEQGARPVEESAKSVVWAAVLESDGPTGGFFRDGKPLPF